MSDSSSSVARASSLAAALVAFQGDVTDVGKTSTATIQPRDRSKPAFSFPYADLSTVLAHIRPVLAKHGLAVLQDVTTEGDEVRIATIVLHESGEQYAFGPLALPAGDDNKQTGGSITSARRFAIMAALGIASVGEDSGDDNGARRTGAGTAAGATARQLAKIAAEAERGGVTDEELAKVLSSYGVETTAELDKAQASDLIDRLVAETDRRSRAAAAGADPQTGEVAS